MEASKEKPSQYQELIRDIPKKNLVYIDERGIDMAICKERSWGRKSEKLVGKKSGKYYERTNIIAGLVNNKPIAPMVFNRSCDTLLFEAWVEKLLIKELKLAQVVIMDNASFYRSKRTRELIESVKCSIIFLPLYSPDLN